MPRPRIILGDDPDSEDFVEFLKLSGQPDLGGIILDVFARPGVDGVGFVQMATRGEPFRMLALRDYATWADAVAGGKAMQDNLQGQIGIIKDGGGVTYLRMVCLRVRPRQPVPVLKMVGGINADPKALLEVELEFLYAGPPAEEEEEGGGG